MKKTHIIILIGLVLILLFFGIYMLFIRPKSSITKYYTYEGNGKFNMSSTAKKVENTKELENLYYVKERITKEKASEKIIEVFYNDFDAEPYRYGYYTNDEFTKYFAKQIDKGLVCDNKTEIAFGEGVNIKCLVHDKDFVYEKVDSELCAKVDEKEVCIKANDWNNIDTYKKAFEKASWKCQYQDYDTGEMSKDVKPKNGVLKCSIESHAEELYCSIGTDGYATCGTNNNWCSISDDLNTNCFGID